MSPRRIATHVGNRGIVLGMLGVVWVLTAVGLATAPVTRAPLPDEQLPVWLRVALWAVPGLLALVAVGWKRLDAIAWGLLILPVAIRLVSYVFGWVTGSYSAGWRGACVYLAVVILVNRCAAGLDRSAPWGGEERRRWTAGSE